jgi:hypothetical protein
MQTSEDESEVRHTTCIEEKKKGRTGEVPFLSERKLAADKATERINVRENCSQSGLYP